MPYWIFHFFSLHFVSFRFDRFRFVSFDFVSFCLISFRFIRFRFVSISFRTLQVPLTINVLFWFFIFEVFSTIFVKFTLAFMKVWKFISGFIGQQTLNFERSLSLSPGPQSSLVPPCTISFGGPGQTYHILLHIEMLYMWMFVCFINLSEIVWSTIKSIINT